MAKVMSAVGVPVYMYEFAEKIYNAMGYQGISSSVIPLGAMHGDDIPHVFGIALFNLPEALRPGKIEFSDNLINSFASFVKSRYVKLLWYSLWIYWCNKLLQFTMQLYRTISKVPH